MFFEVNTVDHRYETDVRIQADTEDEAVANAIEAESGLFYDTEDALRSIKSSGSVKDDDSGKEWTLLKIIPLKKAKLINTEDDEPRYVMVPLVGNYDPAYTKKYYA